MYLNRFDKDFDQSRRRTPGFFKVVFIIVILTIFVHFTFYGFVASATIHAVNENNGSIATTVGHFYKDFKQAAGE